MNTAVEVPSAKQVKAACEKFDRQNELAEQSLEELFRQYPHNVDPRHILLKTVAINALHHTHIFALDEVARHISTDVPRLDSALAAGSLEVVREIAKVDVQGKHYNLYSFATKYCGQHNPAAYPIYDLRIEHALCTLQSKSRFATFNHTDLCNYPKFVAVITAFRDVHGLRSCTFQEIGKFLHMLGEPPSLPLQEEQQIGPGAFDFFPAQELPS